MMRQKNEATSFRLSEKGKQRLTMLADKLETKKADVIERALRLMMDAEGLALPQGAEGDTPATNDEASE